MMGRTPAGILIPPTAEADRWLSACAAIAEIEGWHVEQIVHTWEQLWDLCCAREVDIALVGRWAHLPKDRRPRLVVAEDYRPPGPPIPGPRRPTWQDDPRR